MNRKALTIAIAAALLSAACTPQGDALSKSAKGSGEARRHIESNEKVAVQVTQARVEAEAKRLNKALAQIGERRQDASDGVVAAMPVSAPTPTPAQPPATTPERTRGSELGGVIMGNAEEVVLNDAVPAEQMRQVQQAQQAEKTQRAQPRAKLSKDRAVANAQVANAPLMSLMSSAGAAQVAAAPPATIERVNRERYGEIEDNPVRLVAEHPVSTFSIDVDTGAYANVRRMLNAGRLPPTNAVRIEEMINYFSYHYAGPKTRDVPFALDTALTPTPWNSGTHLLRVAVKGYDIAPENLPAANLVFLVDVSGSMNSADKIGLLRSGLLMLSEKMRAQDSVSIVVYAGASGVVLEPTPGNQQQVIAKALDSLRAGGSTNGAAGIKLAYQVARQAYVEGGINRIVLATDGDFNVGTTNFNALKDMVVRERESGVSLTTLGFGTGNYNEKLMEQLANAGNGNYAYIDSRREAAKVLVHQMAGTLATIAKDVKIQVEFNPAAVSEYRLVGYVNRRLAREDFENDRVDAGEIGAGHTVTALYEVALTGDSGKRLSALRYAPAVAAKTADVNAEIAHLRVRYKLPEGSTSRLVERAINPEEVRPEADQQTRFAAAVAGFAQLLRGGQYVENFNYDDVAELAGSAMGEDADGHRREFLNLVARAAALTLRKDSPDVTLISRSN
jgi:Ca-activated chloride channel family protein